MRGPATTGAGALCRALERAGIECVFGLPGSQTIGLFEALRASQLRTIVATNESSAAMMANGYYRACRNPAVLLTIPGPGFTWALTGVAEAALDSAALLHVTCMPAASPGHAFQLQALDQAALAAPLVKRVFTIAHANDAATVIAAAYAESLASEPGPVLVQVARGVWEETCTAPVSRESSGAAAHETGGVAAVAQAIEASRRCLLLLGQGCFGAAQLATRLAERLNAPVATTTSGRGVVCEDHRLSLGFELGGNRSETLNALIEASDLVLAIGCKFSHNGSRGFRLRIPPEKLIHVDASQRVLGANYPASLTLRCDARVFLESLLPRVGKAASTRGFSDEAIADWRERCRTEKTQRLVEPRFRGVAPARPEAFFDALGRAMPRDSTLVTDSGQHQDLARRHFRVLCPGGLLTPANLQSMTFGIGAAMGACVAAPGRTVVALIGDGGLAMSGLELLTAVRERLRLTVIVLADGAFGAIRSQQLAASGHATGTLLAHLDCASLAAAIGAEYLRLHGDPGAVLHAAVEARGVTLVEVTLADSLAMQRTRAGGTLKRALGARLTTRLRSLQKRSHAGEHPPKG